MLLYIRIFDLKELDRLKIIAAFAVLARFQTLDQNGLHGGNYDVSVDLGEVGGLLETAIWLAWIYTEPRNPRPTSRQPIRGIALPT
jgi:hypothetical protein